MRIRTGHTPDAWTPNVPSTPLPPKGFAGQMVTGSSGQVEQDRQNTARHRAKERVRVAEYKARKRLEKAA